ncbi:NADPH-dependent FMN reductase [Reichenbachiella ulvae]|uniref:NAD(P)H-dependent oxidoreductase n=1 Tax=Reichenbachiella ulvae TaxID=2980104 RepID=A0ABT3CX24_9BACT|nr:NADPH-dependent FMN reductase [Reichenbachiella ulvae]MCV9388248.1 NAD(P)H-dependent oxidoreductase [Reichenbachiella ulvae]
MTTKKNILAICGSASRESANLSILRRVAQLGEFHFEMEIMDDLSLLPHFQTELTEKDVPEQILQLRESIQTSDAVVICSPEYVFSIPSGLKNLIEWCVSTTVFTDKPVGLITASAHGAKGHAELQLLMKTLQAQFTEDSTLLIPGVKGKVNKQDGIIASQTESELKHFVESLKKMVL